MFLDKFINAVILTGAAFFRFFSLMSASLLLLHSYA